MVRRTVSLSDVVDQQVREAAHPDESYSSAVARLIEAGIRSAGRQHRPDWIGSGEGPDDLGRRAEQYLRHPVR
ncbi:MAG: hypothetical protein ACR2MA_06490 [Egibacteraceae bacterium]